MTLALFDILSFNTLVQWFKDAMLWFFGLIVSVIAGVLDGFLSMVGNIVDTSGAVSGLSAAMSVMGPYFAVVNAWVPLDLGFNLLGLFVAFVVGFIVFKLVMKFIPFIG